MATDLTGHRWQTACKVVGMSKVMQECPICSGTLSQAAETCVHCGHPLKPPRKISRVAVWTLLLLCMSLVANIFVVLRLYIPEKFPPIGLYSYENKIDRRMEGQLKETPMRLDRSQLIPELNLLVQKFSDQPFVKPNLFLTPTRVFLNVSEKEISLIFEYDVASSFDQAMFKDGTMRDLLITSYCNADESPFLALNGVQVLFRYVKDEVAIHEEKLLRCEI